MPQHFSREDLMALAKDPRVTPEHLALLSPSERAAVERFRAQDETDGRGSTMRALEGFLAGAGKGAGETIYDLGNLVHKTPVGRVTDALSRLLGGDPEATFGNRALLGFTREDLQRFGVADIAPVNPLALVIGADDISTEARTGAERAGKFVEQVGEFFTPAKATRLATIRKLTQAIPNNLSPKAMQVANKVTALVGRVLGEGGSAAGVSALHGDETPENAAAIAGGTTGAGEALARTITALMKTPVGKELLPYLTAIAASQMMPFSMPGLAAVAGGFGATRFAARQGFRNPKVRAQIGKRIAQGGRGAGRVAAGIATETED